MTVSAGLLKERLPPIVASTLGHDVTVENLRVLTGGASRSTWAFDSCSAGERRRLILRTGAPDDVHAGMELEARAQELAAARGAPVPKVLVATNSSAPLGFPFAITDEIAGETIPRRILRPLEGNAAGRSRLLRQCAQALAAIHRADTGDIVLSGGDKLALWRAQLDEIGDTTATFEWTFRWLEAHRPMPTPPVMVHGDFRMGNLIVQGCELAAVLDWELVHVGEAYEDLAWFCMRAWRFGAPLARGAGGLGGIDNFLDAYEAAGGTTVDRVSMRWWLVRATLSWGVICRYQAHRHLSRQTPSVELAAIGRRVCETEWDLLDLLDAAV